MWIMGDDVTTPGGMGMGEALDGPAGVSAKRVAVNGDTVEVTDGPESPANALTRPVHIHHALRCLAGFKESELAQRCALHRPTVFSLPILPSEPQWQTS